MAAPRGSASRCPTCWATPFPGANPPGHCYTNEQRSWCNGAPTPPAPAASRRPYTKPTSARPRSPPPLPPTCPPASSHRGPRWPPAPESKETHMPTPEQNKETVSTFAREVFGNKNLDHADAWLADDFAEHQVFPGTTPASRGPSTPTASSSPPPPT